MTTSKVETEEETQHRLSMKRGCHLHGSWPQLRAPWDLKVAIGAPHGCAGRTLLIPALQTPGPAAYRQPDVQATKFKAPQYTMAARVAPPGDKTLKPGPGAHSPEKVQEGHGSRGEKAGWGQEPRALTRCREWEQRGRALGVSSTCPRGHPSGAGT